MRDVSEDLRAGLWTLTLEETQGQWMDLSPEAVVARLNGIHRTRPGLLSSWRHGTIADRIECLQRLQAVDPGFDSAHLLTMRFNLPVQKYPRAQIDVFTQQLRERLRALAQVDALRRIEGKPDEINTRYFLLSKPISASKLLQIVRTHWTIENQLHWVLDVAFDEDGARNRKDNGPQNIALLRKIALNLLRDDAKRTASREPAAAEIPDVASAYDLEAAGLARVELRRIETALDELTPRQRAVLLKEIGHPVRLDVSTSDAEKMLRMRARVKSWSVRMPICTPFRLRADTPRRWIASARSAIVFDSPSETSAIGKPWRISYR